MNLFSNMLEFIKKHRVLLINIIFLWISILISLLISLFRSGGIFTYVVDDTYVHMAIAVNIVKYGNWGVNPNDFASASSSILYTLILTGIFFITGPNIFVPLWIGIISATTLVVVMYILFLKFNYLSEKNLFLIMFVMIVFIPLTALIFTGMDHIIQMIFDIIFFYYSIKVLSNEKFKEQKFFTKEKLILLILSPLVIGIRYEGLFLVSVVCLLFFLRKKIIYAFLLGAIGFLFIIIFGLYSLSQGNYLLPTSIMVKTGVSSDVSRIGITLFYFFLQFGACPHVMIFFIIFCLFLKLEFSDRKFKWNKKTIMAIIFILTSLAQFLLSRIYHFFRYESYLVVIGLYCTVIYFKDYTPIANWKIPRIKYNKAFGILTILGLVVLTGRGIFAYIRVPIATTNIYEQQYQMARFIKQYYNDDAVAATDIGAINYYTDAVIVDLLGLSTKEIADLIIEGRLTTDSYEKVCNDLNVQIAIFCEGWIARIIPSSWKKVAEWEILENLACYFHIVSFYAVNASEESNLRNYLQDFEDDLPARVIKRYF